MSKALQTADRAPAATSKRSAANYLLQGLGRAAFDIVRPHLFDCPLERGRDDAAGMIEPGAEPLILFPQSGLLTLLLAGSRDCPIALIGCDGMANHHLLFPLPRPPYRTRVQIEGSALAMTAGDLRMLVARVPELRSAYLAFVAAIQLQVASTLRSSMNDTVEQRLARLLLMCLDRTGSDEIRLHHSDLGSVLGVRRASVTDALHMLEGRLAIRTARGRLTLRDRAAMVAIAGQSYGAAERCACG